MSLNDFISVGKVLDIESWLQGDSVVPCSLEDVLKRFGWVPTDEGDTSQSVASQEVDLDEELQEILGQISLGELPQGVSSQDEVSLDDDGFPEVLSRSDTTSSYQEARPEEEDGPLLSPEAIQEAQGTKQEARISDLTRAWMLYHEFVIVSSIEQLDGIIDAAIAAGKCALDLETQGLDNRIYLRSLSEIEGAYEVYWEGEPPSVIPQTVHKVVGYCLSFDGHTGYYVPVRHTWNKGEGNVDLVEAGKCIRRLCLASQPVVAPESAKVDPLAGTTFTIPSRVKIYFHNAKFDQEFLYPITGIDYWHPDSFEDSYLLYYCTFTDDKELGLKPKSKKYLFVSDKKGNQILGFVSKDPKNPLCEVVREDPKGKPIPYEMIEIKELFGRGREIKFAELSPEEARKYTGSDAICTYLHCERSELHAVMKDPRVSQVYRLEKQVSQVVRWMERNRIKIDREYIRSLYVEAKKEAGGYKDEIVALAASLGWENFDPNSTQQLSEFLFGNPKYLNIDPKPEKNEKSGQYKTDADTLEKLVEEHPDINQVLLTIVKYRQVEKVLGTYLEGMLNNCDKNDEIRYQFKQTGAPTGRFTAPAGDPKQGFGGIPIHGIPATYDTSKPKVATALRRAFVAREGYTMLKVDFAGEELRIVANLSREPVWIKEFNEGKGDLHSITAKAFFGPDITKQQRQMGKCVDPDTLVYSDGRYLRLRELGTFPESEGFADYEGKLFDGASEKPVTQLYFGGVKELYHVVVSNGVLTCTGDHRLLAQNGEWVRVKDLTKGVSLVACPIPGLGDKQADPVLAYSLGSSTNRVPTEMFESRESAMHYLGGLLDGLCKVVNGRVLWTTYDYRYVGQIALMLRACRLPFAFTYSTHKLSRPRIDIRFSTYAVKCLLAYTKDPDRYRGISDEIKGGSGSIVLGVIPAGSGPCLDVTMGTAEHRYQANGLISHNSANFSLVYGGGVGAIMRATKCSKEEAARRKANFDKSVPKFAAWVKGQHAKVKKDLGVYTAFGRWMSLPDARTEEKKGYSERCSLNWPIQGTGADIMKIALVLLYKEFFRRGWLQAGTARFMLTVHDEIVFEVRHEALMEVVPVIEHLMTEPGRMAKPPWEVQLEVEPLLDRHWDPKYDYHKIMKGYVLEEGKKPSKDDIQVGNRWYQPVPDWLRDHLVPDYVRNGEKPVSVPEKVSEEAAPKIQEAAQKPSQEAVPTVPQQTILPPRPPNGKSKQKEDIFRYGLCLLTQNTVRQVYETCMTCYDPEGKTLELFDQYTNEELISPSLGVRVNAEAFKCLMRSRNL